MMNVKVLASHVQSSSVTNVGTKNISTNMIPILRDIGIKGCRSGSVFSRHDKSQDPDN